MVAFTTGAMLEHIIAARILQMDMPCPVDIDDVVFHGVSVKPERRQKQGLLFCLSGRTDFYVMVYPVKKGRMQAIHRRFNNPMRIPGQQSAFR
jgi:hypothetical protein